MKLEVGKTYIRKDGNRVKIVTKTTNGNFVTSCSSFYYEDGTLFGRFRGIDIVEEWKN